MDNIFIYSIGFLSQVLFFARTIAQWFKSEHEGEVISPLIFWQISLLASVFMLLYGILRNDFAIVLGQFIVFFIYVRNIHLKGAWRKMPVIFRGFILIIPIAVMGQLFLSKSYNLNTILNNSEVSSILMIFGSVAQVIFTFRFVYQWIYSESIQDSVLPLGFWIISTIGSVMILTYAILRVDPVLLVAHSIGFFIYVRNILLHYNKGSIFNRLQKFPLFSKILGRISEKIK